MNDIYDALQVILTIITGFHIIRYFVCIGKIGRIDRLEGNPDDSLFRWKYKRDAVYCAYSAIMGIGLLILLALYRNGILIADIRHYINH